MGGKNTFLTMVNKEVQRRMVRYDLARMQIAEDAAFMAAHEVLGLGPGRAEAFGNAFVKYVGEITKLIDGDGKDDKKLEYSKSVIDRAIKPIVGDKLFLEFDKRYGNVDV